MTEAELIAMIHERRTQESGLCERKPDGCKDQEVRKTVVAFANSTPDGQEAVLFIGLNDKTGAVDGVANPDERQKRCANVLDECYPAITRYMYALTIDGKTVVAIVVPASRHKPHFSGGAYVRDGSRSVQASDRLYEELILSRTDLARELIKYKNNHTIVAVRGINYRLGSHKPFSGTHVEGMDCKIEDCSGMSVRLYRLDSQSRFTESLSQIQISFDDEKNKPLILVTAPGS